MAYFHLTPLEEDLRRLGLVETVLTGNLRKGRKDAPLRIVLPKIPFEGRGAILDLCDARQVSWNWETEAGTGQEGDIWIGCRPSHNTGCRVLGTDAASTLLQALAAGSYLGPQTLLPPF